MNCETYYELLDLDIWLHLIKLDALRSLLVAFSMEILICDACEESNLLKPFVKLH